MPEPVRSAEPDRFIGSVNCSTSGCHGGAGDMSKQHTVWFRADRHSRAHSTLTTARSQRMAETLEIGDPSQSQRCTSCHAPFASVSPKKLASTARPEEGVSCESCHGAAENWVRSHTRLDYTRAQRVSSGMRDLEDPYLRANTCVACHQVIEADLIAAGHPKLHFDLAGHSDREPRHWKEIWGNPQLWAIGQLAALRELSGKLATQKTTTPYEQADWESSLKIARLILQTLPYEQEWKTPAPGTGPDLDFTKSCDQLTKWCSSRKWQEDWTLKLAGALKAELGKTPKTASSEASKLERQKLENGLAVLGSK